MEEESMKLLVTLYVPCNPDYQALDHVSKGLEKLDWVGEGNATVGQIFASNGKGGGYAVVKYDDALPASFNFSPAARDVERIIAQRYSIMSISYLGFDSAEQTKCLARAVK